MITTEEMSALRSGLERQFRALSSDAELTSRALDFVEEWLSSPQYAPLAGAIREHIRHGQAALLLDSFYQLVPFGTGGRRGRVGFGPNRINRITVSMSVQGHCNFLRETGALERGRRIVVAFDTRQFADIAGTYSFLGSDNPLLGLTSRDLARLACEIYAANGFEVFTAGLNAEREYLSTPELSFAIRHLGALGGMNVSASHNHPDDNGFKFFNRQGAQDVPPTDQEMASFMSEVAEIRRTPFEEARAAGSIQPLPASLHAAYVEVNLALRSKPRPALDRGLHPALRNGRRQRGRRAAGRRIRRAGLPAAQHLRRHLRLGAPAASQPGGAGRGLPRPALCHRTERRPGAGDRSGRRPARGLRPGCRGEPGAT